MAKQTVESVIATIASTVRRRLGENIFNDLRQLRLLAIKDAQILEAWGCYTSNSCRLLKRYWFTAFSGTLGPKLKEGDKQIPEGFYKLTVLNPNSKYYLSIKVDYPNDFDRAMAVRDNRTDLGGDIFIHGRDATVGCIPVGDEGIEELFYLVHTVGLENADILIVPTDLRINPPPRNLQAGWTTALYARLADESRRFQMQ